MLFVLLLCRLIDGNKQDVDRCVTLLFFCLLLVAFQRKTVFCCHRLLRNVITVYDELEFSGHYILGALSMKSHYTIWLGLNKATFNVKD